MHAGVHDKFTNVRYCLSDLLMVDIFLLPPTLRFLELPPAVAVFAARSEVLANVVSRRLFGALHDILYTIILFQEVVWRIARYIIHNHIESMHDIYNPHIESMHDRVAHTTFDSY